jgi:hypothetical protein
MDTYSVLMHNSLSVWRQCFETQNTIIYSGKKETIVPFGLQPSFPHSGQPCIDRQSDVLPQVGLDVLSMGLLHVVDLDDKQCAISILNKTFKGNSMEIRSHRCKIHCTYKLLCTNLHPYVGSSHSDSPIHTILDRSPGLIFYCVTPNITVFHLTKLNKSK